MTGAATLASRVLGLVRDQVCPASSGLATTWMRSSSRPESRTWSADLFAEGAMSAAFVPAFTRHLTLEGKPAAWRLGTT
jgi:putative peptidoglycan lipid II flippase